MRGNKVLQDKVIMIKHVSCGACPQIAVWRRKAASRDPGISQGYGDTRVPQRTPPRTNFNLF